MLKLEYKLTVSYKVICGIFGALIMGIAPVVVTLVINNNKGETAQEIGVMGQFKKGKISKAEEKLMALGFFGDPNADIFIFQEDQKTKAKGKGKPKDLFALLDDIAKEAKKENKKIGKSGNSRKGNFLSDMMGGEEAKIDDNVLREQIEQQQKELNASMGLMAKDVRRILQANYAKFRKSYELVLIKDEMLEGKAHITFWIGGNAKVSFKGMGAKTSIAKFKNLLIKDISTIKFPNRYQGKKFKMALFFKS